MATDRGSMSAEYLAPTFDAFFHAEYHRVLAFARAISGNWASAEDLTQEAFVAAHRSWAKVSGYERPEAFVRRAVANRSVSLLRRLGRESAALDRLRRQARGAPLPASAAEDGDFWQMVRRLPARQAQVIALHYLEDRSVSDIADVLLIAEGTVKAHLHAARRALATQLGEPLLEEDA